MNDPLYTILCLKPEHLNHKKESLTNQVLDKG